MGTRPVARNLTHCTLVLHGDVRELACTSGPFAEHESSKVRQPEDARNPGVGNRRRSDHPDDRRIRADGPFDTPGTFAARPAVPSSGPDRARPDPGRCSGPTWRTRSVKTADERARRAG